MLTDVTEIVKMQDDLVKSSKLKGMGTFVAGIAHEIKNPLVAVKTFTQLLSKDWDNADLRKKCMDVVLPQLYKINHLSVLLKNMGGSKKTTFEPISVTELIHNVKPLVNLSNDVSFCVDVSEIIEDDVMILANQILLEQMLLNFNLLMQRN